MSAQPGETFSSFDERLGRIESSVKRLMETVDAVLPAHADPSALTGTKRALYDAADETKPMVGKKICAKAKLGYSSYTRRLLADLANDGLLKRVRGGYVRRLARRKP